MLRYFFVMRRLPPRSTRTDTLFPYTTLGRSAALANPRVIEIMVNPDGALRLDRLGEGRTDTEVRMEAAQVERIIRLVASHARAEVHGDAPIVSAALPTHIEGRAGERFEGVLPPVSIATCLSIRKPDARLYSHAASLTDRRTH